MAADVLVCGGVFTHERLSFGDLVRADKDFRVRVVTAKDLLKPKIKIQGDYLILLGLKKLERILRKERLNNKKVMRYIWQFMEKTIPRKIPLIVLDDWTLPTLKLVGNKLRKYLFSNFNVKKYLLREYLTTIKYPPKVVSFTIPCNDHTRFMVPNEDKKNDLFFQGNISSKDRLVLFEKVRKHTKKFKCQYKTMTGGVKNTKDRLSFSDFMKTMGRSRFCLHFSGTGYDCYRYQEIPSVGSIIVTPKYPWKVRNDYTNMKSCIVYENPVDMKNKLKVLIRSPSLMEEMQSQSVSNFKKYHTSEVRYNELKEFINDAIN